MFEPKNKEIESNLWFNKNYGNNTLENDQLVENLKIYWITIHKKIPKKIQKIKNESKFLDFPNKIIIF